MAKKLWQATSIKLHPLVDEFTSADQIILDQELVKYDIAGSMAHAQMLESIGLLTQTELKAILAGLKQILKNYHSGSFKIGADEEDVHTAVENKLVELVGDPGKKLHTGRSRNDQVLVDLKLYIKDKVKEVNNASEGLIKTLMAAAKKYQGIPMPGYTHMQKAMPSSVSMWLESYAETLKDDLMLTDAVYEMANQNPLGSGAGFGVNLPLNKQMTAKLLGFSKVQQNPMACQMSRGKVELALLSALAQIMITLSKFAQDVLLFTTSEFDLFTVGEAVVTGSSIMPQKQNPDVLETIKRKAIDIAGESFKISSVGRGNISGYNRDTQGVKYWIMNIFFELSGKYPNDQRNATCLL